MHLLSVLFKRNSDQSPSLRIGKEELRHRERHKRTREKREHHQKFCLIDTKLFLPFSFFALAARRAEIEISTCCCSGVMTTFSE